MSDLRIYYGNARITLPNDDPRVAQILALVVGDVLRTDPRPGEATWRVQLTIGGKVALWQDVTRIPRYGDTLTIEAHLADT